MAIAADNEMDIVIDILSKVFVSYDKIRSNERLRKPYQLQLLKLC